MATSLEPPSRDPIGGKYVLTTLIGRGGMGSVWEAKHSQLGHSVAIKFIESEHAKNEEAIRRFENEARAAVNINSKYAIRIFDYGVTDDGKPYIVMEKLVGETLDRRLERVGRLEVADVARIVQHVCRGIQRAHDNGIIHRDLKPENIFLVDDEGEEIAKVLDFGIAKMRSNSVDQSVSANTRTGAVLGTPFYMSPEQARGLRDVDHRTDLWSVGVIAYRAAVGRLPFESESLGDLLVRICTSPLPVPSQTQPSLSPAFDAWFARALDRDPAQRFASAQELADALAFLAGLPGARSGSQPNYGSTRLGGIGAPGSTLPSQATPLAATGAPFVTAAGLTRTGVGRGWMFAGVVAGMLGLTIGAVGVVRWLNVKPPEPAGPSASGGSAASLGTDSPAHTPETTATVGSPDAIAPTPPKPEPPKPAATPSASSVPPKPTSKPVTKDKPTTSVRTPKIIYTPAPPASTHHHRPVYTPTPSDEPGFGTPH